MTDTTIAERVRAAVKASGLRWSEIDRRMGKGRGWSRQRALCGINLYAHDLPALARAIGVPIGAFFEASAFYGLDTRRNGVYYEHITALKVVIITHGNQIGLHVEPATSALQEVTP